MASSSRAAGTGTLRQFHSLDISPEGFSVVPGAFTLNCSSSAVDLGLLVFLLVEAECHSVDQDDLELEAQVGKPKTGVLAPK